jgi:hypothetical protein
MISLQSQHLLDTFKWVWGGGRAKKKRQEHPRHFVLNRMTRLGENLNIFMAFRGGHSTKSVRASNNLFHSR